MAAKVYTFHVTYEGLETKIWRDIEVSSKYPLNELGYCILATFDTLAYHAFSFTFCGKNFYIPSEWDDQPSDRQDMAAVRLEDLHLQTDDVLEMDYDFGTTQTFHIRLVREFPMRKGTGKHYPYIIAGEGRGILDDVPVEELQELILQIDRHGKTDEEIYYNENISPWNYRDYSLDTDNCLLKVQIQLIAEGYAPFWEG